MLECWEYYYREVRNEKGYFYQIERFIDTKVSVSVECGISPARVVSCVDFIQLCDSPNSKM